MVGFKCHLSDLECCVRAGFRFRNFFGVLFNSHKFETELAKTANVHRNGQFSRNFMHITIGKKKIKGRISISSSIRITNVLTAPIVFMTSIQLLLIA